MDETELGQLTYTFTWEVCEWSDYLGGEYCEQYSNTVSLSWLLAQWNEAFVNYEYWSRFLAGQDYPEPWTVCGRGLQYCGAAKTQLKNEMTELLNYHGYYDISFIAPVVGCGQTVQGYPACWLVETGHVNVIVEVEVQSFYINEYARLTK